MPQLIRNLAWRLGSAARTTTQQSGAIKTVGYRGLLLLINMTAFGTSSDSLLIEGLEEDGATWYTILAGAAIAANGFSSLHVYPGGTDVANSRSGISLPPVVRVSVVAGNGNAATYSVSAYLTP